MPSIAALIPGPELPGPPGRARITPVIGAGLLLGSVLFAQQAPQAGAERRFPDFPDQDALRYELSLAVDPAARRVDGLLTSTWRAERRLDALRVHSAPPGEGGDWTVQAMTESSQKLSAQRDGDLLTIPLPQPVEAGATFVVRFRLSGSPPDGFYFGETRHGDPIAYTDHYSIRARGWLPCEDHPADRARWDLQLHYPQEFSATAFGEPGSVRPEGESWVQDFTGAAEVAPYMFSVVIGKFSRVAEAGDDRLTDHFVYPPDEAAARAALVHHAGWIAAMEQAFGPYPYAKYTTVQCPTRWGGFEAPGNVQLSEALFARPGGGVGTLAHELVHMWFGDSVGYSRWREVWLSEGFASYFGPWLHAQVEGGPSLAQSMAQQRQRWLGSFEGRTKTIRDDSFPHPDQALNSNTYPKGAWVLHMLRGELGDERFFAALQRYYQQCAGRSVVTTDFVDIVEAVAEQELDWFFDQWLDRIGCPELHFARGDDGLVVEQRQRGAAYRFRLRLRWTDASGDHDEVIQVRAARTVVATDGPARDVRIDPEVELLFRPVR